MEKLKALFVQAVKFGLVGVINTLVDYLSYTLLLFIPFFAENYVLAQIIGYSLGLCNSLVLNKRWTFAQREPMTRVLPGGEPGGAGGLDGNPGADAGAVADEPLHRQGHLGRGVHGGQLRGQQAPGLPGAARLSAGEKREGEGRCYRP